MTVCLEPGIPDLHMYVSYVRVYIVFWITEATFQIIVSLMPRSKKSLPRIQRTSFCPHCGKRFMNETCVLQHMNQPSSPCSTLLNDVSLPTAQVPFNMQVAPHPESLSDWDHLDAHPPSPKASNGMQLDHMNIDNMPLDDQDLQIPSGCGTTPLENLENFQGASRCYPHGTTFMDQFFLDKYGKLHKDNIFYPFTSQKNWQITSWLLCSHLSMGAINSFLSLDLVRYIYLSFSARN